MNSNPIQRKHIENLILSCYLNQLYAHDLDKMEFNEAKIPFELFKASRCNKMIAKAIHNLQEDNKPVDDLNVLTYIQKFTEISETDFMEVSSTLWCTFDTMNLYIKQLKEIDEEETKQKILEGL